MDGKAIDFDEWVKYLFDRPVTDPAWYWNDDPLTELPAAKYIEFGTRLFSNAGTLLRPYSDGQVYHGLYRIISNSVSNDIFALKDADVPLQRRLDFLKAILALNRDCFDVRCTQHLSHLDQVTPAEVSPLNASCYMWWDIFIIYGDRDDVSLDPLNRACIDVMAASLPLSNIAVKEGALHGLGHFSLYYPDECRRIIGSFLSTSKSDIPPALVTYALYATEGDVL